MKNHHAAKVHNDAVAVREEFLARMSCSVQPVVDLLADQSAKQGEENLKKIRSLLILACTWPVTTCTCERCVSALRRLKTYLRSTMGQDRLNGIALMHTHYSIPINHTAVLRDFFTH